MINYLNSNHNPFSSVLIWIGSIFLYVTGDNLCKAISIIGGLMIIIINIKPTIKAIKNWFGIEQKDNKENGNTKSNE